MTATLGQSPDLVGALPMVRKVNLQVRPAHHFQARGCWETPLVQALPFFKSRYGNYVHRVRSGKIYWRDNFYSHTCLNLWCGMSGFVGKKGALVAEPAADDILCATCQGRAIGAGQTESQMICGHVVKFSPRF